MKLWNFHGQQNRITEALQLELPVRTDGAAVISIVGAGGKTSLIFAWARELASSGRKVIITTTTHMLHPENMRDIYDGRAIIYYPGYISDEKNRAEDNNQICRLLDENRVLMIASVDANNPRKVTAPPDEILQFAYDTADVILIEADGSRGMPIKWPAPHEPAVPENTYASVYVAGLFSIGRPLSDVMYNYEALPPLLTRETVDDVIISFLASSPDAGLKGTYGDYRVFLNQADTEELQQKAADIQHLLAVRGVQCAWGKLRSD